jgi:hypothetical protein
MRSSKWCCPAAALASLLGVGCKPFIAPHKDGGAEHDVDDSSVVDSVSDASPGSVATDTPRADEVADSSPEQGSDGGVQDKGSETSIRGDSNDAEALVVEPPLSHLALWLEADRGITLTGGLVSSWADQSGHHLDAGGPEPTLARPVLLSDALSGLPAVRFTNFTGLVLPAGFSDLTAGFTILAVVRTSAAVQLDPEPFFEVFGAAGQTSADSIVLQMEVERGGDGGVEPSFRFNDGDNSVPGPLDFDRWEIIEARLGAGIPGQNVICETLRNGTVVETGTCAVPPVTYRNGNAVGPSGGLPVDVAELLVYDAHEPAAAENAEAYLEQKWGLK